MNRTRRASQVIHAQHDSCSATSRRVLRFAPVSVLVGLTACATIVHGTQQVVPITSNPSGARVSIDSVPVGVTPLSVTLPRGRRHLVSVTTDSVAAVDVLLKKQLSGWVFANAFVYYLPALLDFGNGAAYNLSPKTVSVAFPGSHAADSQGRFVEATLESVTADRLFWRQSGAYAPLGTALASMPIADLRRLHVYQPPNRKTSGVAGMRYATPVAFSVPLVELALAGDPVTGLFVGAAYSLMAAPPGFLLGAAAAAPRWSPLEAHRTGSPLLVNDRLRVRLHDSNGRISGRLVDIEANHLVIVVKSDTLRVPRPTVQSIQRADGFRLGKGARYGATGGALIGFVTLALCDCKSMQSDVLISSLVGALIGLPAAPALAPRRWLDVSKW